LQVWDYKTENIRLTLQVPSTGSFANSCIFSDDSSVILFGGDKFVYAYDNDTGCSVSSFKTSGCIIAILSMAGKYILGISFYLANKTSTVVFDYFYPILHDIFWGYCKLR